MKKRILVLTIQAAFIVGVITLLFRPETFGFAPDRFGNLSLSSLWEKLQSLDPVHAAIWLTFASVVKLGGIFCGIIRWKLLLRGQGIAIPFWYLAKCWFMGRAVGLFLPGTVGLDGYRLVASAAHTGEVIKCTTVIAVEKLIGFIALGLLIFLTLPLVMRLYDFNVVLLAVLLTGIFGFITVSFLLLLNPRIVQVLAAVLPTPRAVEQKINKLGVAVTAYSDHRATLLLAVLFGLGVHLGICLMYFGTAMAVTGGTASFWDVLFASPLVIVLSVISPTVSGAGAREGGFGFLLSAKYGGEAAVLTGHLGLWVGEAVPFILSIPLLLFTTRPTRKEFLEEVAEVRRIEAQRQEALLLSPQVVSDYRRKLVYAAIAGLLGGLIGGGIAGLAEAGWHMSTLRNATDAAAYWWAPAMYGLVFSVLGLAIAAGLVFLFLLFNRFAHPAVTFGLSMGTVLGALVLIVGRFRYQRDVLGEHALSLGQNLMVLLAAVGVALIAAWLGSFLGLAISRARRGALTVPAALVTFAVLLLSGAALAAVNTPEAKTSSFKPSDSAAGPNIILIAVDTLRADFLDIYNPDAVPDTPNISRFARDAVRFSDAFAQSSWTKASFGTIFTGMYPEAHTATGKASALPDDQVTIAEALKGAGYYTKGFSNNPNITSIFNYHQGFFDYVDLKPSLYFGARPSCEKLVLYDILRKGVNQVYARLGGRIVITDFYQPADVVTDTGLHWIDSDERPKDAPFFLFLHYMDPHDPFRDPERPGKGYARVQMPNPDPKQYREAFIRSYSYEVEFMDEHVGRLLEGLKQRGLYDDALIVFTADHGEEFHEHGGWWHGLSLYEEQIAVPLLIKLPGNVHGGAVNPGLARHVDLAPTLARFAHAKPGPRWQGISLFNNELQPGNASTEFIYSHLDFEGILLHSLRTKTQKLIRANEGNKRHYAPIELYDLANDPREQQNISNEPGAEEAIGTLTQMINMMQDFILSQKSEPSLSDAGLKESQEELESLGYLGMLHAPRPGAPATVASDHTRAILAAATFVSLIVTP